MRQDAPPQIMTYFLVASAGFALGLRGSGLPKMMGDLKLIGEQASPYSALSIHTHQTLTTALDMHTFSLLHVHRSIFLGASHIVSDFASPDTSRRPHKARHKVGDPIKRAQDSRDSFGQCLKKVVWDSCSEHPGMCCQDFLKDVSATFL